jgi:hypothetical protein
VTLSIPNSETDGSVSNIDDPNRWKSKDSQGKGRGELVVKKHTEEIEYPQGDGHVIVKETKVTVGFCLFSPHFSCHVIICPQSVRNFSFLIVLNIFSQVSLPNGKLLYTYYENIEGEDEEDEDVANDGSWEANMHAQCRYCLSCMKLL